MFALFTSPKSPVSRTPLRLSRIPPVPPLPPTNENPGDNNEPDFGPMDRVPLPPDRVKNRLLIALCVSLVVNVAFYNQAAVWGNEVRTVFLKALHKQYEPSGPAQIILVAPKQSTQPGGKTTYVPLVSPTPAASARGK